MNDHIKEVICDVAYSEKLPYQIRDDESLSDDLGINSFEMHRLVFELENRFGVVISSEDYKSFITVSDVVSYISANVGAAD